MASGCDHVDHVRTQLPYALMVAAVSVLALIILGTLLGSSPWGALVMLVVGSGVLYAIVRTWGKDSRAG